MKKLITSGVAFAVLASLGMPAAVHAGSTYLTCTLKQSRSIKYGEPKIIGGEVVSVPIESAMWNDWKPLKNNGSRVLKFTLNEADQTGSLFDEGVGTSYKLPFVTFQPETILAKKAGLDLKVVDTRGSDIYTISRTDGSVVWESEIIHGQFKLQYGGQCSKSEVKKQLF